jgi:hypothetical protein
MQLQRHSHHLQRGRTLKLPTNPPPQTTPTCSCASVTCWLSHRIICSLLCSCARLSSSLLRSSELSAEREEASCLAPSRERCRVQVVGWGACGLVALLMSGAVSKVSGQSANPRTQQQLGSPLTPSRRRRTHLQLLRLALRAGRRRLARRHLLLLPHEDGLLALQLVARQAQVALVGRRAVLIYNESSGTVGTDVEAGTPDPPSNVHTKHTNRQAGPSNLAPPPHLELLDDLVPLEHLPRRLLDAALVPRQRLAQLAAAALPLARGRLEVGEARLLLRGDLRLGRGLRVGRAGRVRRGE